MLNSFCSKTSTANCGAPTTPSIPSLRPCDNRLSWFSLSTSANQLRSVFLFRSQWRGLPTWHFFLFSASRFLAAHKKLHSFKPSKRQMAQCPAAMAPLRQPSIAGVAGFRSRCPYRQAGRDREELNLLAQSLLAYLHPGRLGYRSSLPRRGAARLEAPSTDYGQENRTELICGYAKGEPRKAIVTRSRKQ